MSIRVFGKGRGRVVALVAMLSTCLLAAAAHAEPEKGVVVPDLGGFDLGQAQSAVLRAGLKVGAVHEISPERLHALVLAYYPDKFPDAAAYVRTREFGRILQQLPKPGVRAPLGSKVDVTILARRDGKLPPQPAFRLEPVPLPPIRAPETAVESPATVPEENVEPVGAPPAPVPVAAAPPASQPPSAVPAEAAQPAREPQPVRQPQPVRTPEADAPAAARTDEEAAPARAEDAREERPSTPPDWRGLGPQDGRDKPAETVLVKGSPDAPAIAPEGDPQVVPTLVGLDVHDADQLARQSEMTLYIERVPGHPVGRVLEQIPAAGAGRPGKGIVKVIITAGGDYAAPRQPAAPAVFVPEVDVPDVLDRTQPQAWRILEAVGFLVREVAAKRGLPGRVVDQRPAMGTRAPRGSPVTIYIGPGKIEPRDPHTPRRAAAPRSAPAAAMPTSPAGAPQPITPAPGTRLPEDASIPLGFSWRPIVGATAYTLEVEEQSPEGNWLPNERRTVRTTATTLDLVRLDTAARRAFRWRVRVVKDGRVGPPSAWVGLK
jgi:beta-lactam-binding protein with PASTA domain